MKNVWVTVYEGSEYSAHSTEKKAREYAKARLEELRQVCAEDDETEIIEYNCGIFLQIRKADGRMVICDVKIMKLVVK